MAKTITEKYDEVKETCNRHERVFIHRGIPNPQGGFFVDPMNDPDEGYEIPMIRKFAIMPRTARIRLQDLATNGWEEFKPEPSPAVVKKTTKRKSTAKK